MSIKTGSRWRWKTKIILSGFSRRRNRNKSRGRLINLQIIKALGILLSWCKLAYTEGMMKTYDFVLWYLLSLSTEWFEVISHSNLFASAKIILNALLLSHFLPNLLEIFVSLLILRRKPQGLTYLFDAFRKIVLNNESLTILARAHPRAI